MHLFLTALWLINNNPRADGFLIEHCPIKRLINNNQFYMQRRMVRHE
ncbi:MAG: hypothetical protein LBP51_02815 [Deferribacteraceae bacterium]|nr:hypothetical protein [Deferribacteraceae bacterium]